MNKTPIKNKKDSDPNMKKGVKGNKNKKTTKVADEKTKEKKDEKSPITLRWIHLIRSLKLKQLKANIDDKINNYELNKIINDKLLLFLNEDLEESEIFKKIEELKNNNAHLLLDMHKENMNNLQKDFEEQISKMFKDYQVDEKLLLEQRKALIHNINLFYKELEEENKKRKKKLETEEFETMDEIYKNYIAEKYINNYNIEKFKEEDLKNFNDLLVENKRILNQESETFHDIKVKYEKNKKYLQAKEKEAHELQLKIDNWKLKLENEVKIYEMEIERLKNEKLVLLNHIKAIKLILQKLKHNDKQRLIDVSMNSSNCINKLEENIVLANKLINFNNLCKKYETDREKHASSYEVIEQSKEETDYIEREYLDNMKGTHKDNFHLFENFFKRQNKVVLDVMLLKKELKSLKMKNKEYRKTISELENRLDTTKKVKIKKEDFIVRAS